MERVIRGYLQSYLEEGDLLTPHQHGFRPGRSCLSQLLQHYDAILSALENEDNVDVIYLDYAKAFDKLDLNILAKRLKGKGIDGQLGLWIMNWLSGRTQRVSVDGEVSKPANVTSGVPQGSVLGPLLFFNND